MKKKIEIILNSKDSGKNSKKWIPIYDFLLSINQIFQQDQGQWVKISKSHKQKIIVIPDLRWMKAAIHLKFQNFKLQITLKLKVTKIILVLKRSLFILEISSSAILLQWEIQKI